MTRQAETLASLLGELREVVRVVDERLKAPVGPHTYELLAEQFAHATAAAERGEALCWRLVTLDVARALPGDLEDLRALATELGIEWMVWHTSRWLKTEIMRVHEERRLRA